MSDKDAKSGEGQADALPDNVVQAPTATGNRLRDAIQRARITDVERSDVIVNLREAEIARLELLQESLSDIVDELPQDSDLFEFQIQPGATPRLWVDMLAYVMMGRDKKAYRLVQESRHGRQTVMETADIEAMSAKITDYVARRVLERERALASDTLPPAAEAPAGEDAKEETPPASETPKPKRQKRFGWPMVIVTFLFGLLLGAVGLFFGSIWMMGLEIAINQ